MEKTKIELSEGQRVLYHIDGTKDILERTIAEISPSGKLFRIGEKWYCSESSLDHSGPRACEILDELPGKPRKQVVKEGQDEKTRPRPSY